MKPIAFITLLLLLFLVAGCGTPSPSRTRSVLRAASTGQLGHVTLAWDASTGTNVVGYRLYIGPTSGGYTNKVEAGTNLMVTVPVEVGATNYFAATAYDNNGYESDFSNEISYALPNPPPTPTNVVTLTIIAVKPTSVTLAWSSSIPTIVTQYMVTMRPTADPNGSSFQFVLGPESNGITIDWLIKPDTSYDFTVTSYDQAGNQSVSAVASCHTPAKPAPPLNLRIEASSTTSGRWSVFTNAPMITISNPPPDARFFRLQISRSP